MHTGREVIAAAPEVPGDMLRAIFGNLTEPFGDFYVLGLPKASY